MLTSVCAHVTQMIIEIDALVEADELERTEETPKITLRLSRSYHYYEDVYGTEQNHKRVVFEH